MLKNSLACAGMMGKVAVKRSWNSRNYESFSNEDCDDYGDNFSLNYQHQNKAADWCEGDITKGVNHSIECSTDDPSGIYSLPPPASSSLCLPPNRDPPPFDPSSEPTVIEASSTTVKLPTQDGKVDPFYADSLRLQMEILSPGGIEVYVSAQDLEKVAVVELENSLWIAGWNQRMLHLHSLFHLGDQLLWVNGQEVRSLSQMRAAVAAASRRWAVASAPASDRPSGARVRCWLRLRRLPLAKTLIVCRQFKDQKIGIAFDDNGTNKVKSIDPEGPLACTGLPPLAVPFMKKTASTLRPFQMLSVRRLLGQNQSPEPTPELVPWTATEINHRLLNPFFKQHEADLLIGARGMEISVTFQPSDFMEALCKKLKKIKPHKSFF